MNCRGVIGAFGITGVKFTAFSEVPGEGTRPTRRDVQLFATGVSYDRPKLLAQFSARSQALQACLHGKASSHIEKPRPKRPGNFENIIFNFREAFLQPYLRKWPEGPYDYLAALGEVEALA
jgi:hypothetical protein